MTYPKKMASGSAKPLAQLFQVMNLVHEASVEQVPATKRDLYYRDVTLFQTQKTVDTLVDDIAASVELERSDLNVRATSKGTFCGAVLSIQLSSGEIIHGNDSEASLIPVGEDIETFNVDADLAWVLIVEKDGKGYPDMATRHLVKTLAEYLPQGIPVIALVDDDSYGLDILSVYKYGSSRLRHENEKLAAGRIEWLGIYSSELNGLGIDKEVLIPISRHDEKKALSMLRRPRDVMPAEWRKELMHMLHNRRKAEIEILSSSKYLQLKLPQFLSTA
ncbi:hypothetical protein GYMLUDRAFT_69672 [Collybiopsis luxurians FD-317 M1]|nr:hypothetical protein GYMLUDRAFT_69672 [Collybiopsis luxurians FD-317 M1]